MAKKVLFDVTDEAELKAAYPELFKEEVVIKNYRDKEMTYKIVKMNKDLGRPTPGVTMRTDASLANNSHTTKGN